MGRRKDVFLVNLWRDGGGYDQPAAADWRGSVEHVHSRRRLYFTDLIELVAFLAGYTNTGELENGKHGT
jgi:hypothetical protein